ncbi:MAG: TrmH family RNA methyltransferase [Treponema sp.]|nr:TrmH family RNA methyltransferase [Treponema sp.]
MIRISVYKLNKLPRSVRLRKIAKIFWETENLLVLNGVNSAFALPVDLQHISEILKLLAEDGTFPVSAREVIAEAGKTADEALRTGNTIPAMPALRRALNGVRHLLTAETGCFPADWDFLDGDGRLDPAKRKPFPGMQVYLEDIRSPFNVGAMFRAAESFGAEKLWLSPLCADPRHPRAERTAMGCTAILPWERLPAAPWQDDAVFFDPASVFALETGGEDLEHFPFPRRGVMIAGSEELGVSPAALAAADASLGRVSVPVFGAKGSLNVSVAFGIVMHAWAAVLNRTQTHS